MDINLCANVISDTFPLSKNSVPMPARVARHQSNRYTQMTEALLYEEPSYQDWQASSTSSLLFLSGLTSSNGRLDRRGTCSWLSNAAIIIASKLLNPGSEGNADVSNPNLLCVFYSFHPELRYEPGQTQGPLDLLGSVLTRILAWKPAPLRDRLPSFQSKIALAKSRSSDEGRRATGYMLDILRETLFSVASRDEFDKREIYIIIDRLDLCDDMGDAKLHYLMNNLARLVAIGGLIIKILVVVDTAYANSDWDIDDLEVPLRGRIFARRHWDQSQIPAYERRRR